MVAAGDQRGHLRERLQRRRLVVHFERVQELYQRRNRRVVHHLLGERHDARAGLLVTERRRPQDRGDHRLGGATGAVHGFRRVPHRDAHRLERGVLEDLAQRRPRNAFGRRGNERRADDAGRVSPRELPGVRQHRHTAHGMADQDHRTTRCHHSQHRLQVLAQLGDRVCLRRGLARLSVSALVVEDHAHLCSPLLGQAGTLKVEGPHAKTEAVREDHGQRGVLGADFAHGQRYPVRGGDDIAAVSVEEFEVLVSVRVVGGDAPAHGPREGDARGSADGGQPSCPRQPWSAGHTATSRPGLLIAQRL